MCVFGICEKEVICRDVPHMYQVYQIKNKRNEVPLDGALYLKLVDNRSRGCQYLFELGICQALQSLELESHWNTDRSSNYVPLNSRKYVNEMFSIVSLDEKRM